MCALRENNQYDRADRMRRQAKQHIVRQEKHHPLWAPPSRWSGALISSPGSELRGPAVGGRAQRELRGRAGVGPSLLHWGDWQNFA